MSIRTNFCMNDQIKIYLGALYQSLKRKGQIELQFLARQEFILSVLIEKFYFLAKLHDLKKKM